MAKPGKKKNLKPATIAKQIVATREFFAKCFDSFADINPEVHRFAVVARRRQRTDPMASGEAQNKADILAALEEAERKHFLEGFLAAFGDQLLGETTRKDSSPLKIAASAAKDSGSGKTIEAVYQAVVNDEQFLNPEAVLVGLMRAVKNTCKIVVTTGDAPETGTGFLIGPRLVLTCWHVIRSLVGPENVPANGPLPPDTPGTELKGSREKIRVEFDFVARADQVGKSWSCGVSEKWLVAGSRSSEAEHQVNGDERHSWPSEDADLQTFLDFAVIELDTAAGFDRRYFDLISSPPKPADGRMIVLHHPGQYAMRLSNGSFDVSKEIQRDFSAVAASENRRLHTANTIGGSSGGLCLNYDMQPVAIHQAALRFAGASEFGDKLRNSTTNVAVPLTKIFDRAAQAISSRIGDFKSVRSKLSNGKVLIGRVSLQEAIASAIAGKTKIIVVQIYYDLHGPLRQVGKSFSYEVLNDFLAASLHEVVRLSAADVKDDAYRSAAALLNAVNAGLASKLTPVDTLRLESASTEMNDTVARLAKEVGDELAKIATRRTLWVVIDELDKHPLSDTSTRVFFEKLYPEIASHENLRLVLIGLSDPDMPALRPVAPKSVDPLKEHLNRDDIKTWIERRFGSQGIGNESLLSSMADIAHALAQREKELSPSAAFSHVINDVFEPAFSKAIP